jgi:hypothetical protein
VSGIIEKLGIRKKHVLDDQLSILVEEEELGGYKTIFHGEKEISFRVPKEIDRKLIVRLKGLGRKKGSQTGNLLVHVWVNKGEDANAILWLSESSARNGTTKKLSFMRRTIEVVVPKGSSDGSIITIEGQGKEAEFPESISCSNRERGDLFLTLRTYLDYIYLRCKPFDSLDTEEMAFEGWVYRKIDEIVSRIGPSILGVQPVIADTIADTFNESGLKGVFSYLKSHFQLSNRDITLEVSDSISRPGKCEPFCSGGCNRYRILIDGAFVHHPFTVAAILAHELAHIVYLENLASLHFQQNVDLPQLLKDKQDCEGELTVDLLVFMYKLGGFQIRVSRDRRITMGYFRQDQFDRIYVIAMKYYEKRKWDMKT